MKKWIFAAVLAFCRLVSAQEQFVPVDQEPVHKVIYKNDYIEVIHAVLPPGESTLFHSHSHDRAAVILSEAIVEESIPGRKSRQTQAVHAGSVQAQEFAKQPYVHSLKNVGETVFDVIDIELLKRPAGSPSEPFAVPAAESKSFRVYKWTLVPGASTLQHTHSRPYLIIAISKMQLAMTDPGGATMEHPIKSGDYHWIDTKVTHTLTNKGNGTGTIIEVELR